MTKKELKEKILKELFIIDNEIHTKINIILDKTVKYNHSFKTFSEVDSLRRKQYWKNQEIIKKILK